MKKLNKLCAILFAVLGVQTLSAQTDVTDTYLTNADFEGEYTEFVRPQSDRAIYQPNGWTVVRTNGNENDLSILTSSDLQSSNFSAWTINDEATKGKKTYWARLRWGGQVWHWNGTTGKPTDIQLQQSITLPEGVYKLSADLLSYANGTEANNHTYLIATSTNNSWRVEPTINHSKSDKNWENKSLVITSSGETEYKVTLQCLQNWQGTGEYISGFDNVKLEKYEATPEEPVGITSVVGTARESWVGSSGSYSVGSLATAERYFDDQYRTGDMMTQTIKDLPLGLYEVELYANANWTPNRGQITTAKADVGAVVSSVFANNASAPVPLAHQTSTTEAGEYKLTNVKVVDGTLAIGLRNDAEGANWMLIQIKSLKYLGPDLSIYNEALSAVLEKAQNVDQNQITDAVADKLKSAIATAESVESTQEAIQSATTQLNAVLALIESTKNPYLKTVDLISVCQSYMSNSEEFETGAKETFQIALNTAKTDVETATTADAINAIYTTLETARQTYVVKADPTNDTYFDYTFLMTNPAVANGDGWTGARTSSGEQYTGAPDNTYWDSWNGAGQNIYQELTGLPSGLYTLKAAGRASTSCTSAYIYLNDTKVEIEKLGSTGNDLGNGWKWYTTEKTAVAGTAKVGFGCNTASSQWAGADDFHLYYYGFDVETAQAGVATLKAEAEALVGKPMNAEIASALNEAIASADATKTTRLELQPMIDALSTAVNDANASIAEYAQIKTYIDKANTIDESIAAEYTTQYNDGTISETVEVVFQNLEVATYNYVTENFNYAVAISSTWNSTGTNTSAKEFNNEHWSGETRGYMNQNDDNGQGWNANSWSLDFDQDVTLPAGEYVFKVAGRKSANATLQLVVTKGETTLGTVEDFPNGNATRGINKAGAASFDPEDPEGFANNGNGFGWQWRYVKFELAEESDVKIAVHAETSMTHNWVSFGDYTLQMTEETYLEANKGGLDAPTAAAEALVDTKPMGTEQNQALKDALALPVTTGAELLAKIEALNAAVANANAWVVEYNNAKDPLVAAFERFETDFNDGENGALRPMSDEAWATLLEAVKEASDAKDVTNSYYGFAQAADDFNAAMDAAEMAIIQYSGDATCLIKNADFAEGTDSYAAPGGGGQVKAPKDWKFDYSFAGWGDTYVNEDYMNIWAGTIKYADLSQIVNNMPNGTYKLSADIVTDANSGGESWIALYATPLDANGDPLPALTARSKNVTQGEDGNLFENYEVYFNVENNAAVIGVRTDYRYMKIKNFKLECVASDVAKVDNGILLQKAYENRGVTSWDVTEIATNASGAEVYLDNPNAIIYANEGQVNRPNTVVENTAANFELTDGYMFNNIADFTATSVSYGREFTKDTWLTVCLPFAYAIPEGVKVETLEAIEIGVAPTFTFGEVTGTMDANKPYIIKNSTETAALFSGLSNVTVEATPAAMNVTVNGTSAEFIGTYSKVTTNDLMGEDYDILFFGTDGQLYYLTDGSKNITINPFRAYIRIARGDIDWTGGAAVNVRHGGEFTGIGGVESEENGEVVIYDLMGRRVTSMQKGSIYIINGKKVLNK